MNTYEIGNLIVLSVAFSTAAGVATSPTTVTLTVTDPTGISTIYSGVQITAGTTGNYSCQVNPSLIGIYKVKWAGTGALTAAVRDSFAVIP